jgi:hypothetical protein
MAVVQTNTANTIGSLYSAGATVALDLGADDWVMNNRIDGSLTWTEGGHEAAEADRDGGTLATVRRAIGALPSTISLQLKRFTDGVGASDDLLAKLYELSLPVNGAYTKFGVIITVPTYKGATAGTTFTFPDTFLLQPPQVTEGTSFDTISVTFTSHNPFSTKAAYGA